MTGLAVAVVLGSALLHATWNLLLSRAPKGPDVTAVALALGLLAWTPVAVLRWRVEAGVGPYVLASAAFELAYFAALNRAYAKAPAHAVYPVARGLAPALLLPVAAIAGFSWWSAIGVLTITTGVLLTAWGATDRRAVLNAVPVAVCIAAYTFIDAHGLRHADPAAYLWLTMAPVVAVLIVTRPKAFRRAQLRPATFVTGIGVFAAYGLTLVALALVDISQVPAIAALRESSILFVLGLSWLTHRSTVDGRGPGRASAAGAALVFGGVVILAVG